MFTLLKMIDLGVPVRDPNEVLTFGKVMLGKRWLADWPTARRAYQFCAQTRRPMPKSLVLQMTVSVRSATPSLKYCLIREDL
jgi:hypothetical protein